MAAMAGVRGDRVSGPGARRRGRPAGGGRRHDRRPACTSRRRRSPSSAATPTTRCAATQNANPIFWDDDVADELTGGPIAAAHHAVAVDATALLGAGRRPGEQVALKVHFDLKEVFGLPEAVMTDNTLIFHDPVRPGDRISHRQVLKSVSGPKTTKLGSRPVLGDRHRVPQPGRRCWSASSPTPASATGARRLHDRDRAHPGAARPVAVGDALPELAVDVTPTTGRAGRPGQPRLAADAPRLQVRHRAQRRGRHLPEHPQPGRVVRALRHRLDRPHGPARPDDVPHAGLGVPRRPHGVRAPRSRATEVDQAGCGWVDPRGHPHRVIGRAAGAHLHAPARRASPCRPGPTDNPWSRHGDQWRP